MKKYPKMKPSGVEWIGDVPEHWEVRKAARSFKIIGSGTTPKANNDEYYEQGTVSWVLTGDLNDRILESTSKKISEMAFNDHSTLKIYPAGSLIIAMYGATIGKTAILGIPACTNQACCVLAESDFFEIRFVHYWFLSTKQAIINLGYGGGQPNINQEIIKSLKISCPPYSEQTAIIGYLDRKTAQLDQAISEKERLIELFREERQAIINHAVTKGIRARVKMKASGVEWIGDVPEGWVISKLKYIKSEIKNAFVDGPFGSNLKSEHFIENGEVYVIDSGYVTSGEFINHRDFKTISFEHFQTILRSECQENDIVISKIGANFGMSGILPKLDKPSVVSGNSLKLTVNTKLFALKFIHYQLQNQKQNGEIDLLVKGSAQPALSLGMMNSLPILIPTNIEEQRSIVAYLDQKTAQIDTAISGIQQEIGLLREYRQALIFEAVTGKVDVQENT